MLSASQIYIDLCRQLNETTRVSSVSREFGRLVDDRERVDFAMDLLQEFKLDAFDNLRRTTSKNAKDMERYLEEARIGVDWKRKVISYTKALGNACMHADEAIILLERSEVLLKAGKYFAAEEDGKRAQRHNAWFDTQREAIALEHFQQQKKERYASQLPKLTHAPNAFITSASDSVLINASPRVGRFVMAARDINIGDVLVIERPYAAVTSPKDDVRTTHCHECLHLCYNLLPCDRCPYAYFCSETCKSIAWEAHHQYECPIAEALVHLDYSVLTLVALRVALQAANDYQDMPNVMASFVGTYYSGRYREVHHLCTNSQLRTNSDLFKRAINSAILYQLVRKNTSFLIDEYAGENTDKGDAFKALLLHHMQTGPSNFHELTEKQVTEETKQEFVEIGGGVYSFLSLINHSCSPNVVRQNLGNVIVLRALSRIRKGQQLWDNYGHHFAVHPKEDRRAQLKSQYYFDCWCEACVHDWPLYDGLPVLDKQPDVTHNEIEAIRKSSRSEALRMLDVFIKKALDLEAYKPSKNLASAQECIKECFFRTTFMEES